MHANNLSFQAKYKCENLIRDKEKLHNWNEYLKYCQAIKIFVKIDLPHFFHDFTL
jgi:hypothetical protein